MRLSLGTVAGLIHTLRRSGFTVLLDEHQTH